jgi:hypothetical protein
MRLEQEKRREQPVGSHVVTILKCELCLWVTYIDP